MTNATETYAFQIGDPVTITEFYGGERGKSAVVEDIVVNSPFPYVVRLLSAPYETTNFEADALEDRIVPETPAEGELVKVKNPGSHGHGQVGEVAETIDRGADCEPLFRVLFTNDSHGWYELHQVEKVERANPDLMFEKYGLRPLGNTLHPRYYVVATHVSGEQFLIEVKNRDAVSNKIKWLRKQDDIANAYEATMAERQR